LSESLTFCATLNFGHFGDGIIHRCIQQNTL